MIPQHTAKSQRFPLLVTAAVSVREDFALSGEWAENGYAQNPSW